MAKAAAQLGNILGQVVEEELYRSLWDESGLQQQSEVIISKGLRPGNPVLKPHVRIVPTVTRKTTDIINLSQRRTSHVLHTGKQGRVRPTKRHGLGARADKELTVTAVGPREAKTLFSKTWTAGQIVGTVYRLQALRHVSGCVGQRGSCRSGLHRSIQQAVAVFLFQVVVGICGLVLRKPFKRVSAIQPHHP